MATKLTPATIPTPGMRAGLKRLEPRTRRLLNQPTGTLADRNALGLQAFASNPDVRRAVTSFGKLATPQTARPRADGTERLTPDGRPIITATSGLIHSRAVARGQVAQVARARALANGRRGPNGQPDPTPGDAFVADRLADDAIRQSDADYAKQISDTLAEVHDAVDAVAAALPPTGESLLANLPPGRVEQLRTYGELAFRGSAEQFRDRVAETIAAMDRPAAVMLEVVGNSLIDDDDGRFRADPARKRVESALAELVVAFATPQTQHAKVAAAWTEQARRALNLLETEAARPDADERLVVSFQVGSFSVFEPLPLDADAAWYADRYDTIVQGALNPWSAPSVLQPSGRLIAGREEEGEAVGGSGNTLRDQGSRGT